jgi:hypothetical protein
MKIFRRGLILTIFYCLILQLHAGTFNYHADHYLLLPDTVAPPPPPGGASPLSGPSSACIGDISTYIIDVPVACSCQWTLNGIPLAETGSTLEITWTESGNKEVSVVFVCAGGQTSEAESMTVTVLYQSAVFLGNDTTIIQGHTLILDAGNPGSEYLWSTGEMTQIITVISTGSYSVDVSNFCGSDADTIEVSVIVGIDDLHVTNDCFTISTLNRKVIFNGFPANINKIQVSSITGHVIYEGQPKGEVTVNNPGIYIIRGISGDFTCFKKVFVP